MYQNQVGNGNNKNKENSQLLEIGRPTYQSASQFDTDSKYLLLSFFLSISLF